MGEIRFNKVNKEIKISLTFTIMNKRQCSYFKMMMLFCDFS